MTCALFAHIAPSASFFFMRLFCKMRGKGGKQINFCHELFSALNLRKLQYLVCFDEILMTATFTQGNVQKGMK